MKYTEASLELACRRLICDDECVDALLKSGYTNTKLIEWAIEKAFIHKLPESQYTEMVRQAAKDLSEGQFQYS